MNPAILSFTLLLLLGALSSLQAFDSGRNNAAFRNVRLAGKDGKLSGSTSTDGSSTALGAAKRFKNFEQVLETFREEPVIIYFSTVNCGPCRLMEKEVQNLRRQVGDEMKIL